MTAPEIAPERIAELRAVAMRLKGRAPNLFESMSSSITWRETLALLTAAEDAARLRAERDRLADALREIAQLVGVGPSPHRIARAALAGEPR